MQVCGMAIKKEAKEIVGDIEMMLVHEVIIKERWVRCHAFFRIATFTQYHI